MNTLPFTRLLFGLLAASALWIGFRAWQAYTRPAIIVTWSTASEFDTAGFHLYRATAPEGPFEKITPALIPASPDPLSGGEYSFTDTAVEPGGHYYYHLEEVETTGITHLEGPLEAIAAPHGILEGVAAVLLLIVAGLGLARTSRPAPSRQD